MLRITSVREVADLLTQLRVENYAVVEQVSIEFGAGLNLLTGETGAGKSILIDALSLLLGEKASSDVVRHGKDRATVTGVFSVSRTTSSILDAILEENGIDGQESELIVRREIHANGKGRVFLNNQPATVGVLRRVAPLIAFVHAQNETLARFDGDERRILLDRFADIETLETGGVYAKWKELKQRISQLQSDEQERLREVDLWRFQSNEIKSAQLAEGEDERLETERRVLQNAEKLYAAATATFEVLYEEDHSASASIRTAEKHLAELARYDSGFADAVQSLAAARAAVEDIAATARAYAERIDASPETLSAIEDRLAAIQMLKRKYGSTLAEVIAYGESIATKLSEIENKDEVLAQLQREVDELAHQYSAQARRLSEQRVESAKQLAAIVEKNVNDLAMKVKFSIEVAPDRSESGWNRHGWDTVSFLIATNAGEPLKPVEQIASGGELSRVMLAIKAAVFEAAAGKTSQGSHRTLVFDEIDTGIGGRAAEAVGKKLRQLAGSHQVLCITHLPQIASMAHHHFVIEKRSSASRTSTTVRQVTGREQTEEVARMLSGAQLTPASIANAEQMLQTAAAG